MRMYDLGRSWHRSRLTKKTRLLRSTMFPKRAENFCSPGYSRWSIAMRSWLRRNRSCWDFGCGRSRCTARARSVKTFEAGDGRTCGFSAWDIVGIGERRQFCKVLADVGRSRNSMFDNRGSGGVGKDLWVSILRRRSKSLWFREARLLGQTRSKMWDCPIPFWLPVPDRGHTESRTRSISVMRD